MFDFVGKRKIFFSISIALIVITIACCFIFGVGLDVQFKGGSIVTYSFEGDSLDHSQVESVVESTTGAIASVQESTGEAGNARKVLTITMSDSDGLTVEEQSALSAALKEAFPDNNIEQLEITNVDATMGKEFLYKCLVAVLVAAVLIVVYIGIRFRTIGGWSAGMMGIVALLHDSFMVFATFVIFRFPLNDSFIAAVLTILGYSINDTIVIYDRIRENERLYGKKITRRELVNKSINQSLTRTINTTVATVLALAVVCIVSFVCNVDSIVTFVFPMFVGMISGAYSSICLTGPMWVTWLEFKEKHSKKKPAKAKKKK
jgi:preprotein translocase subunit SecF